MDKIRTAIKSSGTGRLLAMLSFCTKTFGFSDAANKVCVHNPYRGEIRTSDFKPSGFGFGAAQAASKKCGPQMSFFLLTKTKFSECQNPKDFVHKKKLNQKEAYRKKLYQKNACEKERILNGTKVFKDLIL